MRLSDIEEFACSQWHKEKDELMLTFKKNGEGYDVVYQDHIIGFVTKYGPDRPDRWLALDISENGSVFLTRAAAAKWLLSATLPDGDDVHRESPWD